MPKNVTDHNLTELVSLHALGALGQHEARAVMEMVSNGHDELEQLVRDFDRVVAAIGMSADAVEPPAALRARLLESVREESRSQTSVDEADGPGFSIVRSHEDTWKRVADRVFMKELFVDHSRGTTTSLLRILPGGMVPPHRHSMIEEIFVIEGDCRINSEVLGPGDYRCAQPGTSDRRLTSEQGTTVLLSGSCSLELL